MGNINTKCSLKHGPRHAISSEGANKLNISLKNVAYHGWARCWVLEALKTADCFQK